MGSWGSASSSVAGRAFGAFGIVATLAGAGAARADDVSVPPATGDSVRATARDVSNDRAKKDRADLPARLADPDTADGRVDGDVGLVVGAGVAVAQQPRAAGELRVRYLDMAGLFATYEDGFGAASVNPTRVVATGLELRPLFLGRWVTGNEQGIRWTDLVVDSFGLEMAAFFEQPARSSFGARSGMQLGLGLELPLFDSADGPWLDLHGGARWSDAVLAGGAVRGPADRALFLAVTLAYHHVFATHLVDLNDAAP